MKFADRCPAGTVTIEGGVALVDDETKLTVAPPDEAGAPRVTVPVVDVPPMTADGETVTLSSAVVKYGFAATTNSPLNVL